MFFNDKEYFKGYVLHKGKLKIEDAMNLEMGDYDLYVSNDLDYTYVTKNGMHLAVVGYILDTHNSNLTEKEIADRLLEQYIESRKNFESKINQLNGRYALIIVGEQVEVYPDATTFRSIFYHDKLDIISSHSSLLKDVVTFEYNEQVIARKYFVNGFLDYSKYENIYKLSPNNYRNLTLKSNTRFFPNTNFVENDFNESLTKIIELLEQQKEWVKKQNAFISFTGGIDSRFAAAIMHDRNFHTFTFIPEKEKLDAMNDKAVKVFKKDIELIKQISYDLNLNHEISEIDYKDLPEQYVESLKNQLESAYSFPLSYFYNQNSRFKNKLHIKSVLQAMGKVPYKNVSYDTNKIEDCYEVMILNMPKIFKDDVQKRQQMLKEYLQRINLDENTAKGHYILDLFYIDQRLGNWHSNLTQETDNTFETFNFVNTRELLELLMSQGMHNRKKYRMHKEVINHFWPVLNFYPVNEEMPNLFEQVKSMDNNSIYINVNKHLINNYNSFKPRSRMITNDRDYVAKLENKADNEINVLISSRYKNERARGYILVYINGKEYDILDLNPGLIFNIGKSNSLEVKLKYKNNHNAPSWQKAGQLFCEVVGE